MKSSRSPCICTCSLASDQCSPGSTTLGQNHKGHSCHIANCTQRAQAHRLHHLAQQWRRLRPLPSGVPLAVRAAQCSAPQLRPCYGDSQRAVRHAQQGLQARSHARRPRAPLAPPLWRLSAGRSDCPLAPSQRTEPAVDHRCDQCLNPVSCAFHRAGRCVSRTSALSPLRLLTM